MAFLDRADERLIADRLDVVVRVALVETVFLRGARSPRAQFSAPSRKTSNARNSLKPGFPLARNLLAARCSQ
jgi:hypothetical protein